jgi:hypothetical protein
MPAGDASSTVTLVNTLGNLPNEIRHVLNADHDLISASRCRELGLSQDRVEGLIRRGVLVAVAKGVYADARATTGLEPWPRFALRSRAFVLASPPGTMAADWSAVSIHGLPTISSPPVVPSVIRQGSKSSGSNRTCHGRTRFAAVADRWLTEVTGTAVAHPAFAAVDLGRHCDPLAALALADAAASRVGSTVQLMEAWQDLRGWPYAKRARWFAEHCDPNVDSPLETAGRLALLRAGLPIPRSNVWVGEHVPRYRLDHYWVDERVAVEGDGIAKYLIGSDPSRALRQEKERGDVAAVQGNSCGQVGLEIGSWFTVGARRPLQDDARSATAADRRRASLVAVAGRIRAAGIR